MWGSLAAVGEGLCMPCKTAKRVGGDVGNLL